jgi:PTS system nitrogen regulatory IIA component
MDIADFITPDRVVLDHRARDKAALLRDLALRLEPACDGLSADTILTALLAREALGSTGLGRGFALPHARLEGLRRFTGLFVRLSRPIAYDAVDGAPVDLLFVLLMPASAGKEQLSALAAVSRRFRDEATVTALRMGDGPEVQATLFGT